MTIEPTAVAAMAQAYTQAWNSGSPQAVAAHYAPEGRIVINRGNPWEGRAGIEAMAAGFFADVPDLSLTCDEVRCAGSHVIYVWTFTGHHAATGRPLEVSGWEEWELDDDLKVRSSLGWYDAEDYDRQVEGR